MFLNSFIPPWVKITAIVTVLAGVFGAGVMLERNIKEVEIATIQRGHQEMLTAAERARGDAEAAARAAENKAAHEQAALVASYEEKLQHEKSTADRRIADLAAGAERLRVAVETDPGRCELPATATGASGGDAPATATISRSSAARLARRYADYNEIVAQLTLCQAIIVADRELAK